MPTGTLIKRLLIAAVVLALLACTAFAAFVLWPVSSIPPEEPIDEYVYLDQGWGKGADSVDRQTYYYTPQGTTVPQGALMTPVRYSWFVNLELPFSQQRFVDPDHMRRYRFIVDPHPTPANPDQLPVGFTKHYEPALGENVLDITCAACHTGEIHAQKNGKRIAIRIDGGQAMHAFTSMERGAFGPTLIASMTQTLFDPFKFDRFARRVIGPRYPAGKSQLRDAFRASLVSLLKQGQNNPLRQLYPVREGFGRTDALGRIANTVFGDHLVSKNYQDATAPVSYPYLWNIWKFDWVQYNGSVRQPLARNIGEALGVGAVLRLTDTYGNPLPPDRRFDTSVNIANLDRIERDLQRLQPPPWPEELLGKVDRALAAQGKELFDTHCQMCHGPHVADAALQQSGAPLKSSPGEQWKIEVVPLAHIGTDPAAATAFVERRFDLSATGITPQEIHGVFSPLFTRDLARDARYRLISVIAGREAAGQPVGRLPELALAYPDPDADPVPSLPTQAFADIAAELEALGIDSERGKTQAPNEGFECGLACQQQQLSWDVHGAADAIERQIAALDIRKLTEGEGLNLLGLMVKAKYYRDENIDYPTQQCLEGFGALDLPQQIAGYKPRPLQGVWATPPFLHNGSVPSVYEMLLPPEKRSVRFFVGRRDYDPKHLGFYTTPADPDEKDGFWLDTTDAGNRNTGHGFVASPKQWQAHHADPEANPLPPGVIGPLFTDAQRFAIIEYLKVHQDLPATPADFRSPDCKLGASR